jgi:serine/threonine-protein phosphatase PGAM5
MNKLIISSIGGVIGGSLFYYYQKPNEPATTLAISETRVKPVIIKLNSEYSSAKSSSTVNWDDNWDYRTVKDTVINSKAKRHILLIRHGQYNLNGKTDQERTLTALGRQQAKLTGQRLAQLELPISDVVISTMTRAQETGNIILEQLSKEKSFKIVNDVLIKEGEPIQEGKRA